MSKGQKDLWQDWFEMQGKMFDLWQDSVTKYSDNIKEMWSGQGRGNVMSNWSEMQDSIFDFWKTSLGNVQQKMPGSMPGMPGMPGWFMPDNMQNFYQDWLKYMLDNFQKLSAMPKMNPLLNMDEAKGLLNNIAGNTEVYSRFIAFWNDIARDIPGQKNVEKLNEFSKNCLNNYNRVLESYFSVNLPEDVKELMKNPVEIAEMYQQTFFNFFEPWQDLSKDIQLKFTAAIQGDEAAYQEFMEAWNKAYQESYGRVFRVSAKGMNRESFDKLMSNIEKYMVFIERVNEFSAGLYNTGHEVMEDIIKKSQLSKAAMPKEFNEFYRRWWDANDEAFNKLFDSQKFQDLLSGVVDAWIDFKKSYDEVLVEFIGDKMPIPTMDMDGLNEAVSKLKNSKSDQADSSARKAPAKKGKSKKEEDKEE